MLSGAIGRAENCLFIVDADGTLAVFNSNRVEQELAGHNLHLKVVSIHAVRLIPMFMQLLNLIKVTALTNIFFVSLAMFLILIWLKLILVLMGSSALVPISQTELWLMWSMGLFILGFYCVWW